ncbi:hypothetical protein FOPG_16278 [Fusarium oxysporum f. sp. conglutinans race 2 54008]|uniref:Uncharacterized protein n=3 Tax=Fusarium oxysporum TaxID=5507 RepID=A0A2H3FKT2_FUSOX|nr:hypothetical protein FOZG_17160 [Fusarium oxysporum Fo47]EXL67599.1 hypothetical protein FOPG_16278 [Fusarium oxysporum f. sp. conglutinans race 2 54008]KAI8417498.1 hypothetical protein FOFC_00053 [Fusarium oxysporum]PCD20321.1 hypothetical protein AU210_016188 [Fusarium oxysporum f. sp. radicis-cucumerinum]
MSSENPPNHQGMVIRVEERTVITWIRNVRRQRSPNDYHNGNLQYPSSALKTPDDEALRKPDFSSQQDDELSLYLKQLQSLLKGKKST